MASALPLPDDTALEGSQTDGELPQSPMQPNGATSTSNELDLQQFDSIDLYDLSGMAEELEPKRAKLSHTF